MSKILTRVVCTIGALFYGLPGLWAFFAPQAFAENIATFPPYSRHLVHDIGSFMIGLAAVMLATLVWSDAVSVALAGIAVGSAFSGTAHILDFHLGGRHSDPYTLFGMAALAVITIIVRQVQRSGAEAAKETESAATR
jgi:uncharacterized membrane protein YuzA (DUF378 family)